MKESQTPNRKSDLENLERVLEIIYSAEPHAEDRQRAQARLTKKLSEAQKGAILYGQLEHPMIDNLYVATRSKRVVAINFGISEDDFIQQIEKQFKAPIYYGPEETTTALRQIKTYLDGNRTTFDLPVDISLLTEFQQQVLQATRQIPRGKIATYMDIARKIGKPKAARAVGQALGRNPIPIVIPCHRVIASNGSLGGYSGGGGLETKANLLKLEGAMAI